MSTANEPSKEVAPFIDVKNLSYAFVDGSSGLQDVVLNLPPGSRTLIIGGPYYQSIDSPLTGSPVSF